MNGNGVKVTEETNVNDIELDVKKDILAANKEGQDNDNQPE